MHSKTLKQALKHDYDYIRKQLAVYVVDEHKRQYARATNCDEIYDTDKVLGEIRKCHSLLRQYGDTLPYFRRLRGKLWREPKWKVKRAFETFVVDACCVSASLFDTGNKLEFVADITSEWGPRPTPEETVYLWRLRYPIDIASWGGFDEELDEDESEDDRLQTLNTLYVVTSASNVPGSGPETYVFAVDRETKHPTHRYNWNSDTKESERLPASEGDWGELHGSYRGALDHMEAIRDFQRWLLNPFVANKRWRYHKQA
jgi:hypothetical protein